MPGVFRKTWFPRRRFKGGSPGGLDASPAALGLAATTQFADFAPPIVISNPSLTGEEVRTYPIDETIVHPAGGGGGGAAGIFGHGEDGEDGTPLGIGGYGGSADNSTVPRQTTAGADGHAGTEIDGIIGTGSGGAGGSWGTLVGQDGGDGGLYGGGGGGGGGAGTPATGGTGGYGGQGADGVVYIEYVGLSGLTKIIYHRGDTGPFVVPTDWTTPNRIILVGPGGCGDPGSPNAGGNGGFGGDTIGVENTLIFNPGDIIPFAIPTTPCSQTPTTFGPYSAAGGGNAPGIPGGDSGGSGNTSAGFPGGWIYTAGQGGPGGRLSGLGLAAQKPIASVSATAQIGVTEASAPDLAHPRTFWITGIKQKPIAAGTVLLPTSENVTLSAPKYAIGSSQFYTIGEAHWNGAKKTQGVNWDFVAPFKHIIEIEDAGFVATAITLIYYRWDIGVRSGFTVTSYPVQFTFNGTTIIAERAPAPNQFFSVHYTMVRPGTNPMTLFARYPAMVDDLLSNHLLYDGDSGFESYRPTGYRVFDTSNNHIFSWNGTQWQDNDVFANNTKFYVKRKRAVYNYNAGAVTLVYTAGDPLGALPETLAYPSFGEGIGKNLLADGFSLNAAVDYPTAYQVATRPGLYNDWGTV